VTDSGDWVAVRYVAQSQRCDFCWQRIPKGSPGNRTGERGTKAWYNAKRRVWECMGCRTEGFRAEEAREAMDRQGGTNDGQAVNWAAL
jgi:hypothetical protein